MSVSPHRSPASGPPTITTTRLILRPWRETDCEPFAELNADPRVMEFMPKLLDRAESDARVKGIQEHFDRHGFGLWAVEVPGVANFIGFVGFSVPRFVAEFTPCVEAGWRLAYEHWGHGYATEAARAAVAFAFDTLALDELVSYTVPANVRSRQVMERLGMTRNPSEDFDHPLLAPDHPLCRHVMYRLRRSNWIRQMPAERA